jgi:hypothetical protein
MPLCFKSGSMKEMRLIFAVALMASYSLELQVYVVHLDLDLLA